MGHSQNSDKREAADPASLLTRLEEPALHLIQTSDDALGNLARRLAGEHPGAVIRTIRGRKSRTPTGLFDEAGAALQLPSYFGENWNAFDEVLGDLEWLPGDAYLLLIADADQLLADADDDDFRILCESVARARVDWLTPNRYFPRNRPPTPFHALLQVPDEERLHRLSARLGRVGVAFDVIKEPTAPSA